MENYLKLSVIGKGAYGTVYKVKCRTTGKEFALKHHKDKVQDTTVRELSVLTALKGHLHVVYMHDCFVSDGRVAMLLSYVPYTLSGVIHNGHGLNMCHESGQVKQLIPLSFVAHFSRQVAHALSYMHALNMVHRDLTPFNVLLTEDLTVKLADMGLSRQASEWMSPNLVTEAYRAPELFDQCERYCLEYTCAIDMWSLGHQETIPTYEIIVKTLGPKDRSCTAIASWGPDTIMPSVMKCTLVKRIVLGLLAFRDTERPLAHELLRDAEWAHVSHMNEEDRVMVIDQIRKGEKKRTRDESSGRCCNDCSHIKVIADLKHEILELNKLLDSERERLAETISERAASSAVRVKGEGVRVDGGGQGRDAAMVIDTKGVTRPLSDGCRHLLYELELCKKDLEDTREALQEACEEREALRVKLSESRQTNGNSAELNETAGSTQPPHKTKDSHPHLAWVGSHYLAVSLPEDRMFKPGQSVTPAGVLKKLFEMRVGDKQSQAFSLLLENINIMLSQLEPEWYAKHFAFSRAYVHGNKYKATDRVDTEDFAWLLFEYGAHTPFIEVLAGLQNVLNARAREA
ncbi:Cyclin-dependent kinase 1 [Collichthys lucidus]|uniref:Cyclin-dependent kinase 1 n=1 Tax=Collichthys lucidus TaxID=240159 RepID=A0A4U5VY76_COLLU|nr:Cyclin-dependent kinase 1 [Collichthys lucidus]